MQIENDALAALLTQYQNAYSKLADTLSESAASTVYGVGGEEVHRGYYCPSPIMELVVGNVRRGQRRTHPSDPAKCPFHFYLDTAGRLLCVDRYSLRKNDHPRLVTREFILYEGPEANAITFTRNFDGSYSAVESCICRYNDAGHIAIYQRMIGTDPATASYEAQTFFYDETGKMTAAQSCQIDQIDRSLLQFMPRKQTDAVVSSVLGADHLADYYAKWDEMIAAGTLEQQTEYLFVHDKDGRLTGYYAIEAPDNAPHYYEIPKGKQRIL